MNGPLHSRRVAAGVRRISTPLPFRPREVHAYLVEREAGGWFLVDGGLSGKVQWERLDAGVREVAAWGEVALQVVTHMHVDHLGLMERVVAESGAPLAMGALDAERAAHARAHPAEEAAYREELLRGAGVPGEELGSLRRPAGRSGAFPPVAHPLEGERGTLPLAPEWEWVWTPGHTAGHIALHRPADGVVIAGDAVLPRVSPTIGVNRQREDPVADYLGALDRLDALRPRILLPGHGEPLASPGGRIRELREEAARESGAVCRLLSGAPATPWELARRRYAGRELPPTAWMQALRETLAHLRHLAATRGVRRDRDAAGVERYSL